jgi:metallo-beta-lactamase family protein
MTEPLHISFEGAARTVTGSRHRLTLGTRSWLFDCGLYQGRREEAYRVNRAFDFDPAGLAGVVVSHAHIDHTGNLPTLVSRGFAGKVHATPATADLSEVMLPDSGYLMQKDVEYLRRHRKDGAVREPLYSLDDVTETLGRFETHGYHETWTLDEGIRVTYHDAGHILGSALTRFEFESGGRRMSLGMSGDLGRPARPILRDPEVHAGVDVLVLESTYGDRLHADAKVNEDELVHVVQRTADRGGRVLVPAFAVGRTQELVATFHALCEAGRVCDVPIYVDSPMARKATEVFVRHPECFDEQTREAFTGRRGAPFGFDRLRYVGSVEESKALNDVKGPCIIIAASGMCEGGRILHHLRHGLGDARNTVLFVGYQAQHTLGRRLRDGAEEVSVLGDRIMRRAEVAGLEGFSAHADQSELVAWVMKLDPLPRRIFLVHGDLGPAEVLAGILREKTGAQVSVPERGEEVDLWK